MEKWTKMKERGRSEMEKFDLTAKNQKEKVDLRGKKKEIR